MNATDETNMMRLVLLLADTQHWMNELSLQLIHTIQPAAKKMFASKSYHLSITAFAHIVERHHYKILRHPGTGKFHVSLAALLDLIKDAASCEPQPVKGSALSKRSLALPDCIGVNKNGDSAASITVITDAGGNIITAFPE